MGGNTKVTGCDDLKRIKPGKEAKEYRQAPSLYLLVLPSGSKSWKVRFNHKKKRYVHTLGKLEHMNAGQARRECREYKSSILKKAQADSECRFIDYLYVFMQYHTRRHSNPLQSKKLIESRIKKYIKTTIDNSLYIKDITPRHIEDILIYTKELGGGSTALKLRGLLLNLFQRAVRDGLTQYNPVCTIPARDIHIPRSRDRVFSKDEIRRLFNINAADYIIWCFHFLLLTMVRKQELLSAQWSWVDWNERIFTIPKEVAKNRKEHVIKLPDRAMELLYALKKRAGASKWIVPSPFNPDKHLSGFRLNQVIKRVAKDVTIHDLRRTGATLLAEEGHDLGVIESALNHTLQGVKGVYNRAKHTVAREKLLQSLAGIIDKITEKKEEGFPHINITANLCSRTPSTLLKSYEFVCTE